jgi:hypothetical protein
MPPREVERPLPPRAPRRRRVPGPAAAAAALVLAAAPAVARAEDPPDGSQAGQPAPTPRETPPVPHRLRAAAELGLYLGAQLGAYLVKPSPTAVSGVHHYSPLDKLSGRAVTLDANSMRTNFGGHALMGATLYQMTRGNRLPAWESALWAVAGSATWELMEFREAASLNDLVVTPVAGVAIGEPLFQLGAHLDRAGASPAARRVAWLLSPWMKLHDWLDGARPAPGDPEGSLDYRLSVGAGRARTGGWQRGQATFAAGWTLVRDRESGCPGEALHGLLDGQVSGLSLRAAVSAERIDDLRLDSGALLASVRARDLGSGPAGTDAIAGAGVAFAARLHAWARSGLADALVAVHLPHLSATIRWRAGAWRLAAAIDAGLAAGGARSFVLDGTPDAVPASELPTVQSGYGYHFAAGPALRAGVEVAWASLRLSATPEWAHLWPVLRPDPARGARPNARLEESWSEWTLRAAWRLPGGLEIGCSGALRGRWSRADAATRSARESILAVDFGPAADG